MREKSLSLIFLSFDLHTYIYVKMPVYRLSILFYFVFQLTNTILGFAFTNIHVYLDVVNSIIQSSSHFSILIQIFTFTHMLILCTD